ncbi:MAG: HAS-barrel domain-containing protein [Cyanobacteria bacterium P01_H01_bin.15]
MVRVPLPQFATDDREPGHIGEVIETATTEFVAQCLEPETLDFPAMPPFGSWVKAQDEESGNLILAVVTYVTTCPIDSVHRARALGMSLEELREQQPQIFAMLKTEFRSAIAGFIDSQQKPFQYLPPRPPQIHQAVHKCTAEEVLSFTTEFDFLRMLLQVSDVPTEALVGSVLRDIYQLRKCDRSWLVAAGRALSLLMRDNYDGLKYILGQIHSV